MQLEWLSKEDPTEGRSVCHFHFCCHLPWSFNLEKGCIYLTLTYVLRQKGHNLLPLVWNGCGGRDTALDVTVVHPLQSGMVVQAAVTPGHALQEAYKKKMQKSWEDCRRQGLAFLPLAAESLGGWHEVAIDQVKKLGAALARQQGQEEGEVLQQLWQKLSILLQRGNAALFTNRIPDSD